MTAVLIAPRALPGCRPAAPIAVAASVLIDTSVTMLPLTLGLLSEGSSPVVRLLLVTLTPVLLVAQISAHCRHGRALGGLLMGLRTVDATAGLPTGDLRALLTAIRLGRAVGAVIVDIRTGPDPATGTLVELEEQARKAAPTSRRSPSPSQQQPPAPTASAIPRQADSQTPAPMTRRQMAAARRAAEAAQATPITAPVPSSPSTPGAPPPPPSIPPAQHHPAPPPAPWSPRQSEAMPS